jgi:hypothetical protein
MRQLFAVLLWLLSFQSYAVVLDFNAASGFDIGANYHEKGFILSVSTHYDIDAPGFEGTRWFGFDDAGETVNPDYLGPSLPSSIAGLYVVHESGQPFTLTSLFAINSGTWSLSSPKGGAFSTFDLDFEPEDIGRTVCFCGPEWSNVPWLLFSTGDGFPVGFDQLSLQIAQVPAPGALWLLLLGLLMLRLCRLSPSKQT